MKVSQKTLQTVIPGFCFAGELFDIREIESGHINGTYRLSFRLKDGGERRYILQKINTFVFKNPEWVMENIQGVTGHLRKKLADSGENPERRVLTCVPTMDGKLLFRDDDGNYWRAYDFIENAIAYDRIEKPEHFREAGRIFGLFQRLLSDYPVDNLHETIPDFHNTKARFKNLEKAISEDKMGRAKAVREEIAFIRERMEAMEVIENLIEGGGIPLRVTHNDTKINNVMLDADTGEGLCAIDMDTVMAGSVLHDFGDAIRSGAMKATEDEADLKGISLDMRLFEAFSEGFISQIADMLTWKEAENLALGALVMTCELAARFLTDYLEGDVYFKNRYPGHNLARMRVQAALLKDMETKKTQMDDIINKLIAKG